MGRVCRAESCPYDEINVVHCVNRCVRRAFLCGRDDVTDQDYEHRRGWIRACLERLATTPLVSPAARVIKEARNAFPGCPAILAAGPRTSDLVSALAEADAARSEAGKDR